MRKTLVPLAILISLLTLWTAPLAAGEAGKIRIGLSLDTLKEERWQKDRDLFVAKCKALGA